MKAKKDDVVRMRISASATGWSGAASAAPDLTPYQRACAEACEWCAKERMRFGPGPFHHVEHERGTGERIEHPCTAPTRDQFEAEQDRRIQEALKELESIKYMSRIAQVSMAVGRAIAILKGEK